MFTQVPGMQAINVRTVQHSPRSLLYFLIKSKLKMFED